MNSSRARARTLSVAALALLVGGSPAAWPHGGSHPKGGAPADAVFTETVTAFGRAIRASQARRTIEVSMSDAMRFTPSEIRVRQGERVRIVVRNSGRMLHELVLGTSDELASHAELMRRFPNMEHEEPYMAHVDPGRRGEIAWQFTEAGEFFYGCLIPGHFEAGMVGKIIVTL